MTGAELLVRCLDREGVEYVFGVPGEQTFDLNNALADSKIRFIPTRPSRGVAFMADVYGRLTGRAGVCLATLGPGATNLATVLPDANLDRAPGVAITGQASRDRRMHKESQQHVNIVDAFGPFTKWNAKGRRWGDTNVSHTGAARRRSRYRAATPTRVVIAHRVVAHLHRRERPRPPPTRKWNDREQE